MGVKFAIDNSTLVGKTKPITDALNKGGDDDEAICLITANPALVMMQL